MSLSTMSLSTKIFAGLFLGIAAGLFFGEMTAFLDPVGDGFVQLLKMAVLPYIVVSLVAGLGRLNYGMARDLFLRVGGILLLIWAVTFAVIAVVPLTFPDLESASFFSTALLETPKPFDFLQFIPENPFGSMANNVVPAVVVFSIALGVALMGVENKDTLIENLEILGSALTRVMVFVARLTPIGVFAIAASSAGTMRLAELGRLQVYVIVYSATCLLLTFCVLPALATTLAPVRYRDILSRTKDALVTAFATDSLLVVLPMLSGEGKGLVSQVGQDTEGADSAVDVIVPASFNFPNVGKLLQLSFVLFAAWFTESVVSLAAYLNLMVSGLFGFFGKPVAAMPFLLDQLRIPADMFQLYLASGVVASRFGTLAAAMQTFVLAVVGALAMAGLARFRWPKFLTATVVSVALLGVFVVSARAYFQQALSGGYDKGEIIAQMQVLDEVRTAKVYRIQPDSLGEDLSRPALDRIRERGFIRVGYVEGNPPFQFFNGADKLVGFDSAMTQNLAGELGVDLEFVPAKRGRLAFALNQGRCDLIMSGIVVTPERAEQMALSTPYLDMTLAFVVRDHQRSDFESREAIQSLDSPRIAVFESVPYFVAVARELAPNAELVPIQSPKEFFEDDGTRFDALEYTAEMGAAYSLLNPEFSVAIPHPDIVKIPVAYAMALGDPTLLSFIDAWVDLKQKDGTIQRHYDYWILGQDAAPPTPRWSVIRDVLHWVD
jgi:Na+/H+-dicarboxylate symporter